MKLKHLEGDHKDQIIQDAQDAVAALTPDEIQKLRKMCMAWTRLADMSLSEFIGLVLDKRQPPELWQ